MLKSIEKHLETVVKEIQQNIIDTGKEATGDTRKSVRTFLNEQKTGIQAASYIGDLETGTPPKSGVTIPEISRWAIAKPVFTTNVSGFAFFTAKKIEAVGSTQFIMKKFDNIFSSEIKSVIQRITKIALNSVKITINENLNKNM